jgi:hypothetical protein
MMNNDDDYSINYSNNNETDEKNSYGVPASVSASSSEEMSLAYQHAIEIFLHRKNWLVVVTQENNHDNDNDNDNDYG